MKIDSEVRECSKDFTEGTPGTEVTAWRDVDGVPDVVADVVNEFVVEMVDVLAVGKKSLFNNAIMWMIKVVE